MGTAELCDLFVECSKVGCTQRTSYRDQVVMQALLRGMHDVDIRTRVLSRTQNDELKGLSAVVDYTAAEEASSASFSTLSSAHTIALQKSSYKKQTSQLTPHNETSSGKCTHCGGKHPGTGSVEHRKQYCKAYDKKCTKCSKAHHFANVCKSAPAVVATTTTTPDSVTGALITSGAFYAMQSVPPSRHDHLHPYIAALCQEGPVTTIPLPHLVHSQHKGWATQAALPSPTIPLEIKIDRAAYSSLRLPVPRLSLKPTRVQHMHCCADTGAQLSTVPVSLLAHLGVQISDLLPIATNLNTVTGTPVDLVGGILLHFSGANSTNGKHCSTRQLAYVSKSIPYPFLSREACMDLGLVPLEFPSLGSCTQEHKIAASTCSNSGVANLSDAPCSCPIRQLPPNDPPVLPCKPTVQNLNILREYIVNRYAASAFNMCEQQPLPLMQDSPPLRLFIDKNAKPIAVHSPAAVPLHWEEPVKAGLERDLRLGVIDVESQF